jgi:hypothetical protein
LGIHTVGDPSGRGSIVGFDSFLFHTITQVRKFPAGSIIISLVKIPKIFVVLRVYATAGDGSLRCLVINAIVSSAHRCSMRSLIGVGGELVCKRQIL